MKNITALILVASLTLGGCATSNGGSNFYEPYQAQEYNTPWVNGVVDSTVSIVRTQTEGFIAIKTLTGITGWLY